MRSVSSAVVLMASGGSSGSGTKRRRTREAHEKLQRLLHVASVSTVGLAKLLKELREMGPLDDVRIGRSSLAAANESLFMELRSVMDLPLTNGRHWCWEFVDPNKLLQKAVESDQLQSLFAAAVREHRPSVENPWRLIVGFDEFTPGSV